MRSQILTAGMACGLSLWMGPLAWAAGTSVELKAGAGVSLEGRSAQVLKYQVLPLVESSFSKAFVYDKFENPKLKQLRAEYHLDEVVAPGKDEMEKLALLINWAHNRFDFGEPSRWNEKGEAEKMNGWRDALQILSLARKEQKFFCVQYASVFMAAANSLGYVVRPLGMATHTWTEAWSNQYGRWVHVDATANYYWELSGVPVDTFNARAAGQAKTPGMTVVKNGVKNAKTFRDYPNYDYIGNNNWMDAGPNYRVRIDVGDKGQKGADLNAEANFPINQAALTFTASGGGLEVAIQTLTPNFQTFRARVDEKSWADCGEKLTWALHPGKNTLEVRSVNKFGVEGYPSTVVLDVK